MKLIPALLTTALLGFFSLSHAEITVEVDPYSTLAIEGESELKRERYFSLSDSGVGFDRRVGSEERLDFLVNYLNIEFGRNLGPVRTYARNRKITVEDSERPGFADLAHLKDQLGKRKHIPSERMLRDFGPNMNVAAHGNIHAYPDFMGLHSTEYLSTSKATGKHSSPAIPENIEASAELAANVLKHAYHDLTRPRYFEPINEPHWSYLTDPDHIADWHVATRKAVSAINPEVLVGGPCVSVGYFANQNYQPFKGLQKFIEASDGQLDFYSFHVYDYYRWENQQFSGSILGGLPLEGSLDLVANHLHEKLGKSYPLVISEHGGYASSSEGDNSHVLAEQIASKLFPGSGFEWRMKARSIHEFVHVDSVIRNTLAFMDHPHTVIKAVPFILLESSRWDPLYYACLYVKKDFDAKAAEFVPSTLSHFYALFRDLAGHRVWSNSSDPDIQVRSFVNEDKLFIVTHNLADKTETITLRFPEPQSATLRLFGRHSDETPFLKETPVADSSAITLKPRETAVLIATYGNPLAPKHTLNQTVHYGDRTIVPVSKNSPALFTVQVPLEGEIKEAILRIGLNRAANLGKMINVTLNGTPISVPLEDSANRITTEKHGYSTCKIFAIDPDLLKDNNQISVSFADEQSGTIGSAVLRVTRPR